ncbi:MAG: DUF4124 domain-containing protein [Candidatus Accumulibacter sp.]|nr:DUF4124 domain-containing protein [Candidatus Accumulibacter propinquus]
MKRFVLTAALLCIVAAAQAQIYKWQDQNNRTVISDRPPTGIVRKPRTIEAEAPPRHRPRRRMPARRWPIARWISGNVRRSLRSVPRRRKRSSG